jgi:uncharacterized protein (DUF1499 family)
MGLLSGRRPANLGVRNGKLAPCSWKPNCVCSQSSDATHAIAPIDTRGDPARAFEQLKSLVRGFERVAVIVDQPEYFYAEFTSATLGFVDDMEFLLDAASGVIHVRSASRLGIRDFGVNRGRVEAIRAQLAPQPST